MDDMKEFYAALAIAQSKIKPAVKDKQGGFAKYAPLENIWEVCVGPLTEQGFCITETFEMSDKGEMILVTTLAHKTGGTIVSKFPIRPIKTDPQGYGSAISYARRYSISPLVGVVVIGEDDDAEEACNKDKEKSKTIDTNLINKEEINILFKAFETNKQLYGEFFNKFNIKKVQELKKFQFAGAIEWINVMLRSTKNEESPYDKE